MDPSAPPSGQARHRVAILVDGDNFPHSGTSALESGVTKWGDVIIRKVFGDMTLHKGWANQTAYAATHCTTSAGKNRADMTLVVAAMDLANRGLSTAFVIASDDRDFDPLISHLRQHSYRVERIGKPKAETSKKPIPQDVEAALTKSHMAVLHELERHLTAKGEVGLKELGSLMTGITVKERTGKASWRAFLTQFPSKFVLSAVDGTSTVRLKT